MVIDYLDSVHAILAPFEAYPPLFVDAYAMLALTSPFQRLQSIRRRNPQIVQCACVVDHDQLALCYTLDVTRQFFDRRPLNTLSVSRSWNDLITAK
jgi:hypothetical protein